MPRPSRPWFRFYSEQLESRKSQTLGRQDPALFFQWVNMLCLANITEPRGYLPTLHDTAFALRVSDDEAQAVIDELQKRKFVSKEGRRWRMHDWDDWQKKSDAYQTPGRRERHADGTSLERVRNTDGTHREEEEKEEEIEKEKREKRAREPKEEGYNPASFEAVYAKHYADLNPGKFLSPIARTECNRLEREFGREACIEIAEDYAWEKHPNYLREALNDPKRAQRRRLSTPEAADSGVSAEHERLGLGQPARMVANTFVQRDANGRALKAVDAGGVGNG